MGRVSESKIKVRYQETDQMGVVYHANYLVWFEVGRTDYIKELGMTYADLEKRGLLLPVIEANCKYRKPAKYDEEVTILTTIQEVKGARLTFSYQAVCGVNGELLAEGSTQHVFTTQEFKPINLRTAMPDLFDMLSNGK